MEFKAGLNIIVTGGASGLGQQIVSALAEAGHNAFPYDAKFGQNVTNPSKIWIENLPKKIDVLINCAGINLNQWFEEVTDEDFFHVMDVNAYAFVRMTQAVLEQLKASKGTVINIVSNASHIPMTSSLAYNASKAAALMITKQMAHELTPKYGITVFSISPNKLEGTGMSKQIEENVIKTRGWSPEYAKEYQKKALMHGLETPPVAVAELISTLLTAGISQYMSGTDIPVGK